MPSSELATHFLPSTALRFPIPFPPLNMAPPAGKWGFYKIGFGSHICKGSLRQSRRAVARQLCPCRCAPLRLPTLKKTPFSCRSSLSLTAFLLNLKKKKKNIWLISDILSEYMTNCLIFELTKWLNYERFTIEIIDSNYHGSSFRLTWWFESKRKRKD